MAQHYPTTPQVVYPIERVINDTIDRLIWLLNVRRAELLVLVHEKRAAEKLRLETIKQLTDAQTLLHEELRQSINQPLKDRMIWKLECKKRETILDTLGETRSELKCDTRELETIISRLGEIEQVPVYVPHYATLRHILLFHCSYWEARLCCWRVVLAIRCSYS